MKHFLGLKAKLIYIYSINDDAHKGALKIGEATCDHADFLNLPPNCKELNAAAKARINQQTQTAGIAYKLLHTEITPHYRDGGIHWFNDTDVHDVLLRSGIKRKYFDIEGKANEWFEVDLPTAVSAIRALKEGRNCITSAPMATGRNGIQLRPEQKDAIEKTKKVFKRGNQMLWNAKMRFGKTLTALKLVKELDIPRTLILTHRPVVDQGWFDDFKKLFCDSNDCDHYAYGSKQIGETFASLQKRYAENGEHFIYFASIQDLRGSEAVGGKFDKNNSIFQTPWDLIIVDEAHEGTQTNLGQAVMDELVKKETKVLRLSGTPFNLLDNFKEDEIYTWDYVMEQRAKADWYLSHPGDPNPYASLPTLNIYTYDLGRLLKEFADEEYAFNFREFFKTDAEGKLVHEKDVKALLNLLTKEDNDSCYPFASKEFRDIFRHTLWIVPGVKAARALSAMLKVHPVFEHFDVVNVAGNGDEDEENGKALEMVRSAIGKDPSKTRTITLSCGRLTTGVTVPEWTGVLMLAGTYNTAAAAYMQTIFRVQSPATINGCVKEECYVFDFAPDRTLTVLATVPKLSVKPGAATEAQKRAMGDFINFCPVIAVEGSKMEKLNVTRMLQQLKKAYVERVVNNGFQDAALYNDELLKLSDIELKEFDKLKGIIGKTKAIGKTGDIDINNQGLTNEEYEEMEGIEKRPKKQRTPEEEARLEELRKRKKVKDDAISILRGISIRMPLMIYGARVENEDEELTIDNFTNLIDPQSWEEFMPRGVTKQRFNTFKKYYDPEIFSAAAKRIRSLVKNADSLNVEERIERITSIFSTFRNPDKETVLTPWRVVNMHLGDTLGGYNFYNDSYTEPIEDPRYIDRGKVTADVFNPQTHLLEINSKTGLYPLLLAYNVYRSRCKEQTFSPESVRDQHGLWNQVVAENIFVVCKTKMAKSITQRTLLGFRPGKTNMWAPEDLINKIKNQPDLFIKKVHNLVGKNVNINAIVGNPPYQEMDGGAGASARPVYNLFVDVARDIKPDYISMIMPAKWFTDGKGLGKFRESMFADRHISQIYDFVDSRACFPAVDIAGGVCYFLWDKSHDSDCTFTTVSGDDRAVSTRNLSGADEFVRYSEAMEIVEKVKAHSSTFLSSTVSTRKPFGLGTDVVPCPNGDLIIKTNKGKGYYKSELVSKGIAIIPKWKVVSSYLTAEHAGQTDKEGRKRMLASLDILQPNEICSETYLVLDSFDTGAEAESFFKYMKTRFVRFLISLLASTQHLSKEKFALVPMQDFTDKGDIDWSKPVADIDRQLYAKYNLTPEETAFIESMIKPM